MKINNALKRLIDEAEAEARSATTEPSRVRCLFRHALCRKTRLSKAQATWVWHNVLSIETTYSCLAVERGDIHSVADCANFCDVNCVDFKLIIV